MASRFVGTLAATLAALGILAGTAGASSNHGSSGYPSITSIFNSPVQGTCNAALHNDSRSESYTSNLDGYPGWFCGQE